MKTAVIIGATGLVGSNLLVKLAQDPTFSQIIAIVRSRNSSIEPSLTHPKTRRIQFSFENWNELELQVNSFAGSTTKVFFCCLGSTIKKAGSKEAFKKVDHEYFVEFAKLAQKCRAEQLLVVSALGADKKSPNFYLQVKGEAEHDIQESYTGKLHFLRPSLLLGDRKDFRFAERIAILLAPAYSLFLMGPLKKFTPVKASAVAKVMFKLATKKISASIIVENSEIIKLSDSV